MVAFANGWCVAHNTSLPAIALPESLNFFGGAIKDSHAAWRYTLMSGVIPAIPLMLIRPFLPESPKWQAKKEAGTLRRPSFAAIFAPSLRRTTIVTTLMVACSYGVAFGAIQQMQHILPGLPQVVKAKAAAASAFREQNATLPAEKLEAGTKGAARGAEVAIKSNVTEVQEIGGLLGRIVLAVIVVWFVSRRNLIRVFLLPGLIVVPFTFAYALTHDLTLAYIGMFLTGLLTVAQFSFWGNYLPMVYPLHLRGTGESFAANIGGRMIGTSFAAITAFLATQDFMPGTGVSKTAYTAAFVGGGLFLANLVLSFFLPEPVANIDEEQTIGHAEASPMFPATVEPKRV